MSLLPFHFFNWMPQDRRYRLFAALHLKDRLIELYETHRGHEVIRQRRHRGIRIAPQNSLDYPPVLCLNIPWLVILTPKRKPTISLALFVQHISKTKQPE